MTHFAYITHILYCTLYKLQTTCLCVKYFVKNLHRAETIYTGGARGARDKYQVCMEYLSRSVLGGISKSCIKQHTAIELWLCAQVKMYAVHFYQG